MSQTLPAFILFILFGLTGWATHTPDSDFVQDQQTSPQNQKLQSLPTESLTIKGKEKHSYQLTLKANDYVNIVVDQKGIDVVVRVNGN